MIVGYHNQGNSSRIAFCDGGKVSFDLGLKGVAVSHVEELVVAVVLGAMVLEGDAQFLAVAVQF